MENGMTIMIVEDDKVLANEVKEFLTKWSYVCFIPSHFDNILKSYNDYNPNLVLMDINLPFYDGYYWCQRIREVSQVPIIYMSSRNDDRDKIIAIAQGGDDYVEKPFSVELLKAKIEAVLRRTYQYKVKSKVLIKDHITYDINNQSLFYYEQEIELTKSEQLIMTALLRTQGNVVTRNELMMQLWSTDEFVSDGTLSTLISRLRTKLIAQCGEEIICTKKGMGYHIK